MVDISVKQDCFLSPEQYEVVDEKEIADLTTGDEPIMSNSIVPPSRQFYKTEDETCFPIPYSSFSFSDYLFRRGIECEIVSRKQKTLEVKYWQYMEFYTHMISKTIHLFHSGQIQSPFIVFFQPSIQQMYFYPWSDDVDQLFRKLWTFLKPIRLFLSLLLVILTYRMGMY